MMLYYISILTVLKIFGHSERAWFRSMAFTTITFYSVSHVKDMLAVVRYTAYDDEGSPVAICEDHYGDTPEEFCRIEQDVETALVGGIDVSVMSHYESDMFPVISDYLNL